MGDPNVDDSEVNGSDTADSEVDGSEVDGSDMTDSEVDGDEADDSDGDEHTKPTDDSNRMTAHKPASGTSARASGDDFRVLDVADEGFSAGAFRPTIHDLKKGIIPGIEKRFSPETIPSRGIVPPFCSLGISDFKKKIMLINKFCKSVRYMRSKQGHCKVKFALVSAKETENPTVEWPDFSTPLKDRPTISEAEAYFEDLIKSPPKKRIAYFGGNATIPGQSRLKGGRLAKFKHLEVAGAQYFHIGPEQSATAFHHEDSGFRSLNMVDYGYKLWLLIDPSSRPAFEEFVRETWKGLTTDCDQFVRHLQIICSPSLLRKKGIQVEVAVAGPGEIVMTKPYQYHAVVNYTPCIARSINFLLREEPIIRQKTTVCSDCGLSDLRDEVKAEYEIIEVEATAKIEQRLSELKLEAKRKPVKAPGTERVTRARSSHDNLLDQIKKYDPRCGILTSAISPTTSDKIIQLAATLLSRKTLQLLCSIIEAWMANKSPRMMLSEDPEIRLVQNLQSIVKDRGQELEKLRRRVIHVNVFWRWKCHLNGGSRADSAYINKCIEGTDLKYHDVDFFRTKGKQLAWLCGMPRESPTAVWRGIISLIPPAKHDMFGLKSSDFVSQRRNTNILTDAEVLALHSLIDTEYFKHVCSMAAIFQDALEEGRDVDVAWKGEKIDWSELDDAEVIEKFRISLAERGGRAPPPA